MRIARRLITACAAASGLMAASAHALVVHLDPPGPAPTFPSTFDFVVDDPSYAQQDPDTSKVGVAAEVIPLANIPGEELFSDTSVYYVDFGSDGKTLTFNAGTSQQFSEVANSTLWQLVVDGSYTIGGKTYNDYEVTFGDLTSKTVQFTNSVTGQTETGTVTVEPAPEVPEPATWALMLVGFGALGAAIRGRRRSPAAA